MAGPFDDLIPKNAPQPVANPFADLIPQRPQSAPQDLSPVGDWAEVATSPEANKPFLPWAEGVAEKAAQGATAHVAPHIAAATGASANWLARKLGLDIPAKSYQDILNEVRGREQAFTAENPGFATAAEIGGALAPGATGAGFIARAPGLMSAAARSAAVAAPYGALASGAETAGQPGATARDVGIEAAKGGGVAALTGGAFNVTGNIAARTVGPWATDVAQNLIGRGIRLTPGETMGGYAKRAEDSLVSAPFLGAMIRNRQGEAVQDFNRTAAREAVSPDTVVSRRLRQTMPQTEVGHDLVAEVQALLNARYGQVVPRMRAQYDQPLVNDLNRINARVPMSHQPAFRDAIARWIDNSATFADPGNPLSGTLDGPGLQNALGGLRDEGRGLLTAAGSQQYDRQLGHAILDAHDALEAAASRSTNTRTMNDYRRLQRAYAGFARIRDAASRIGADQGVFTPAQLMNAVRTGDRSAGKGATAAGNALMQNLAGPARAVMARSVNDSGTPERAALLGAILNPALAAKALLAAAVPAGVYTRAGSAAFRQLATMSPAARMAARRAIERAAATGVPVVADQFGGQMQ